MADRSASDEPVNKLKTDHDYHVYEAYRDPEFISDIRALKSLGRQAGVDPKEIARLTRAIAQEYALTVGEVNWYRLGRTIYLPQKTASASYGFNRNPGRYFIEFDIDAPKAEIDEAFAQFNQFRKFLKVGTASRQPHLYPDIVYRTFRLRRRGLSFNDIHKEFGNPQSPYYDKRVKTLFSTWDKLRRHYNRHKPD